jgi:hypothetical protein
VHQPLPAFESNAGAADENDHEPQHPILTSYTREIAIADKDHKLIAWRRCIAKAGEAIRRGLIDYPVASDGLLDLADDHGVFGLLSREKAETDEDWRALPHEADRKCNAPTL